MNSLRPRVLSGYRRLLRARLLPFMNDNHALSASRVELKTQFMLNKDVSSAAEIEELLKGIDEVEEMLRSSVVQGRVKEDQDGDVRVGVQFSKENAMSMDKDSINPLEHLGEGLGEEKSAGLDDIEVTTTKGGKGGG